MGIVGIGAMGMPMLERLCASGHEVGFRPRRPDATRRAISYGATPIGDFVDRDVVIVCVYSDDQVRAIGPEILASMKRGSTLVNHTTGSPVRALEMEAEASPRGIRYLDAALSGSPAEVSAGTLTLLIGGDDSVLEDVRPVLATYGDPILRIGGVGDGQRVKLINNALFAAQAALIAEAGRVARELGLGVSIALDAIQYCSGDSRALRTVVALGSADRFQELAGSFLQKDVSVVEHVAGELGIDLGRLGTGIYRLADIEAIKQLKARYFRFIDTKRWDEFRDLFTADCEHFYISGESSTQISTNAEYWPMMETMLTPGVTTHHGHTPEITLLSDTEAEGTWAMHDYVQVDPPSGRVSQKGYGYYFETYRKCDDGKWRISSKRNVTLRVDRVPWTLPG